MKVINILVPDLPESVNDATIIKWYKNIGESVNCDDNIVDIETDKVMLEVSSPCNGILKSIIEKEGNIVTSKQIIGEIIKGDISENISLNNLFNNKNIDSINNKRISVKTNTEFSLQNSLKYSSPSLRRLEKIHNTNNDCLNKIHEANYQVNYENTSKKENEILNQNRLNNNSKERNNQFEERVKMTRLRQKIAERLLESKNNTAMLTTFNEVNMQPIIFFRKKYGQDFEKKYGIRIGFMSFFVKAVVQALKKFPQINASIDKTDIVFYKNFDISIAISTPQGLITPVLRNPDNMSMLEIEKKIKDFSIRGSLNKIKIDELIGGNFTITNGGVFGSLMSTPIINPPQTAILGMHVIKDRTMVIDGKIKILPMMYLALSYDHRLVDGKESVSFLITIKNILEDFSRILIDI